METLRTKRLAPAAAAVAILAIGLVLQACIFSSAAPLVDAGHALRLLPDTFIATEVGERSPDGLPPREAQVYTGRYTGGKYALIRQDDEAAVDISFADLGNGDLLMMMEWHIDEDTPFMYLTARYQPPFVVFDDPSYLADNIDEYRRRFSDDIALIRDDSKFNDSLKIDSVAAAVNAIRFYREHNDREGAVIRYRIEPLP